jgi:hypothetical protein
VLRRLKVKPSRPDAKSAVQAIKASARKLDSAIAGDLVLRNSSKPLRGKRVGGVSLFIHPSTKAASKSPLAKLADRKVYSMLGLSRDTKWHDIALEHMPMTVETVDLTSYVVAGNNGSAVSFLPAVLLEQLQRSGALEQFQLDGVELARRALFGLGSLGPGGKGGDLGPGGKGGDLGPGGKGGDLGPSGKGGDLGPGGKGGDLGPGGKGGDLGHLGPGGIPG